jgi:hypothetical protein
MVNMMVCNEKQARPQAALFHPFQDGRSIRHIYHHSPASYGVMDDHAKIVALADELLDLQHYTATP